MDGDRLVTQSTLKTKAVAPYGPVYAKPWSRPADWLPMPTFTPGEHKYAMLYKVHNGPNPIGFRFIGCDYTVDWGDGSAPENFTNNTTASHDFSWSGCGSSTLTSRNYRQALVVVTPTSPGGVFTTVHLVSYPHPSVPANTISNSGMLDLECSSPGSAFPAIGSATTAVLRHPFLEHVKFRSSFTSGSWAYAFAQCRSLQSVEGLELSQTTNTTGLFLGCVSLETAPAFDTSLVTTMSSMFNACWALVDVPTYDYSSVTMLDGMFSSCTRLVSIGVMNTSAALTTAQSLFNVCTALRSFGGFSNTANLTNITNCFNTCVNLITVPDMNLPKVTTVQGTFSGCASLITAPAMTFSSLLVTMASCFDGCTSLRTLPAYNTASVQNFSSTLNNCRTLVTAPSWDLSAATTVASMFAQCMSIVTIPSYNFSNVTTFNQTFQTCTSLRSFVSTTTTANTTMASMFTNCYALEDVSMPCANVTNAAGFTGCISLKTVVLTGLRFAVTVASNQLRAADLDALYTSLGTASGAQAVTVTSNPGITGDNVAIATAKGWTVTGS